MICLDKLKPIPEPVFLVVKKGMNIFSSASGSMPVPLSFTAITGRVFSLKYPRMSIDFSSCSSKACAAFFTRLMSTCSINPRSARIVKSGDQVRLVSLIFSRSALFMEHIAISSNKVHTKNDCSLGFGMWVRLLNSFTN